VPRVCVDTQIWEYANTEAVEPGFEPLHQQAGEWLRGVLSDKQTIVVFSLFEVAEILEVFRKQGVEAERRAALLTDLLALAGKYEVVPVDVTHVAAGSQLSSASGVHLWDYLVALPVAPHVSTIYSCDRHFQHEDFKRLCTVENPLGWETVEGQKPQALGAT